MTNTAHQTTIENLLANVVHATPYNKTDWQVLEVKQLSEIAHRYRQKARYALNALRMIEARTNSETDSVEKIYANYEAMFARDALRAAYRMYNIANRDFHQAYAAYMTQIQMNSLAWQRRAANQPQKTDKITTDNNNETKSAA